MHKVFAAVLAVLVSLGTTAVLANGRHIPGQLPLNDTQMNTDGAFRDGLYVGKLAGKAGRPMLPAVARWSSPRDRASFVAGYQRGYNRGLVSSVARSE